jgi:ParB/RepB/Spo0J family partition protein
MAAEPISEVALAELGQRFAALRIVHPAAELRIRRSLEKYGQLSPVVASRLEPEGPYELLDGFKRFRAARELGLERLHVRVLALGARAAKAAMLQLNWVAKSVHHLEEALVLFSLVREDALTQTEVAVLLGRHKSWVSRRIALVERLCEEVKESLRLGLTSVTIARELGRLPRGNQEPALACVQKHGLTWRETRQLVSSLLPRPRREWDGILKNPWELLPARIAPKADLAARSKGLGEKLLGFCRCARQLAEALASPDGFALPVEPPQLSELTGLAADAIDGARRAIQALERAFGHALPSRAESIGGRSANDSAREDPPRWS